MGFLTVRDKKPKENSVDSMYFVEAAYPYAKMGGVNALIKMDKYFWTKADAASKGGGISVGLLRVLDTITGGSFSVNGGVTYANSMEFVAGGEMYMALRLSENPCLTPEPEEETTEVETSGVPEQPAPELTCDVTTTLEEIYKLEGTKCPNLKLDNFDRHRALANGYIDAYACTEDETFLENKYVIEETGKEFMGASGHFARMEYNLYSSVKNKKGEIIFKRDKQGKPIFNPLIKGDDRKNAITEMREAYKTWAGVVYVLEGEESAAKFVKAKNRDFDAGIVKIPTGFTVDKK